MYDLLPEPAPLFKEPLINAADLAEQTGLPESLFYGVELNPDTLLDYLGGMLSSLRAWSNLPSASPELRSFVRLLAIHVGRRA